MRRHPLLDVSTRRALRVLEGILVVLFLALWLWFSWHPSSGGSQGASGRDSVQSSYQHKSARTYIYNQEEEPVETFPFDPNTADSTTLLRLGLAPWQVRAVYRYRAKHGRYHEPGDFRRLPGMTNELWERLSPYIRIDEKYQYVKPESNTHRDSVFSMGDTNASVPSPKEQERDTIQRPVKYEAGVHVDLNAADTTSLKKIPGIASYRAQKIVEYRCKLGGYVRVEQVMEACKLPDDVLQWFTLTPVMPALVPVNHSSIQKLMRHPYISFYQARSIVEYRKAHGDLRSVADLQGLEGFTSSDIERLSPYLDFK